MLFKIKRVRLVAISIFLCIFFVIISLFFLLNPFSIESDFERITNCKMLPSIEIMSESSNKFFFDSTVNIFFKISPSDFDTLIAQRKYKKLKRYNSLNSFKSEIETPTIFFFDGDGKPENIYILVNKEKTKAKLIYNNY